MTLIQSIIQKTKELLKLEEAPPAQPAPKPKPKPVVKPRPKAPRFSMYDSVDVSAFPSGAVAVAGYENGKYANINELKKRFPRAKHLGIDVLNVGVGECLDIETGDASPADAPGWVRNRKAAGVSRPVLYASLDTMPAVKSEIAKRGIKRSEVRLWVAHYTYEAHIPLGYDACQWTDKALGRNLDQSLCNSGFLL